MMNCSTIRPARSGELSLSSCGLSRITNIGRLPSGTVDRTSTSSFSSSASFLHNGRGNGCSAPSTFHSCSRERIAVRGIWDYWGGDLLGFDLDDWSRDVEDYGSIAIFTPPEGGYEGRYCTRLRYEGYHFLDISARGLGDPEAYLTKVHGIRPAHLGKQPLERFDYPPEVDYRLSLLPRGAKGLVVYVSEAKVLSKTEMQFLALLPALRKNVKVIAECGSWRKFRWKPLREFAGLPVTKLSEMGEVSKPSVAAEPQAVEKKPSVNAVV